MNDDRAAWHAERLTGLGGTDSAPALGLSPWVSPLQLHMMKTGEVAPPDLDNEDRIIFGKLLEPVIREEYVRRTGRQVVYGQGMIRSSAYPWMLANLDGFVPAERRVFEAKTARDDRGWGEPGTDAVPQHYLLQVMHYMVVTESQLADIAVLIGGSDFRIYTVELDRELADLMIAGERRFWEGVQRREPPPPTTLAEINLRWKESRPVSVELPPNLADACVSLRDIKDKLLLLQATAEKHERQIKLWMGEADTATIDGVVVATWKQAKGSRVFDSKSFRAAHPDVAEKFMVENPGSRRFLLKG